jgi:hypothetical protein
MNQELSFSELKALEGVDAATTLKAYPLPGNGIFYSQASGTEDCLKLSLYKFTFTPDLLHPAVSFSSSKFALDLSQPVPGVYTLHQASRTPKKL